MTPEGDAKKQIADGLKQLGWKVIRLNSGKVRVKGGFMQLCPAGTPDILCFDNAGALLWVECKAAFAKKRNDQPEQAEFAVWARSVGHRYVLARCLDDVLQAVR